MALSVTGAPAGTMGYNERSFAIDVISAINIHCASRRLSISRAGGEESLKTRRKRTLFPDVTLYGDTAGTRVRHGWELKMPDTPIDDPELISNAIEKADSLGTDSFLLWNVTDAVLYRRDASGFAIDHQWPSLPITSRAQVKPMERVWKARLMEIVAHVDGLFSTGALTGRRLDKDLGATLLSRVIDEFAGVAADEIRRSVQMSALDDMEIQNWWFEESEFRDDPGAEIDFTWLGREAVTVLASRLFFTHAMKSRTPLADAVDEIQTATEASELFGKIDREQGPYPVYTGGVAVRQLGAETWDGLLQLNSFLSSLRLQDMPPEMIQELQAGAGDIVARRSAGQFCTAERPAEFAVKLGVHDRHGAVMDPCVGSGAILKVVRDCKLAWGQSLDEAAASCWGSDRHEAQVAMTRAMMSDIRMPTPAGRITRRDVFELAQDISAGACARPTAIVSNLPFVRSDRISKAEKADLSKRFPGLSGRSDLSAYMMLNLAEIASDCGTICVLLSNAWSGSEAGRMMLEALAARGMFLRAVVAPGQGRWFRDTDVTANIVLFTRDPAADVVFATLDRDIHACSSKDLDLYVRAIHTGRARGAEAMKMCRYDRATFEGLIASGLPPSALFADLAWVSRMEGATVSASDVLEISRGERWGCNALFYPGAASQIEARHCRPALRSSKDISGYDAQAASMAFVCEQSEAELQAAGDTGALAHIARLATSLNEKGRPIKEILSKSAGKKAQWYAPPRHGSADFVLPTNPHRRIFVARLSEPAIVDQRLIRLTAKTPQHDLLHALLNSAYVLFQIEALGFPRALGALDLTPTKLVSGLRLPDPARLDQDAAGEILDTFARLKRRGLRDLDMDLQDPDRIAFDKAVARAFGFEDVLPEILGALGGLYEARLKISGRS